MGSAFATEDAGIEEKPVDLEFRRSEQAVFLEVSADPGGRGLVEAGEGEVGGEFAVLGFKAEGEEAGGNLALEDGQGFAVGDPGPDHARLATRGEEAEALEAQGKDGECNLGQGLADIEEGATADLADEAEGEVELFRRGPAGSGQAAAEQGDLVADC